MWHFADSARNWVCFCLNVSKGHIPFWYVFNWGLSDLQPRLYWLCYYKIYEVACVLNGYLWITYTMWCSTDHFNYELHFYYSYDSAFDMNLKHWIVLFRYCTAYNLALLSLWVSCIRICDIKWHFLFLWFSAYTLNICVFLYLQRYNVIYFLFWEILAQSYRMFGSLL